MYKLVSIWSKIRNGKADAKEEKPYSIIVRPIDSVDAMSAQAIDLGIDVLKELDQKIRNHCSEICGIFYDVTSKPSGTIEWE